MLVILAAGWFLMPGYQKPVMNTGILSVTVQEDGGLLLEWPEQEDGVFSLVSVETKNAGRFRHVETDDCSLTLSDVSLEEPLKIRIQAAVEGKNLLQIKRQLVSKNSLDVAIEPKNLPPPALEGTPYEDGHLVLTWDGADGESYEVCTVEDGVCTLFSTVRGSTADIRFHTKGGPELPESGESITFAVRAAAAGKGYLLYGPLSQTVTVTRNDLLSSELVLECAGNEDGSYVLSWNETKGDHYLVQEWDGGVNNWRTLRQINPGEERSYETGILGSGSSHRYRVAALYQAAECASGEFTVRVGYSPLYATVWPIQDLPLYNTASKDNRVASVPGGTALCVLEETEDGLFFVRYQDIYGYLDSRFCMINLPEYTGSLCAYDITNSYSSAFTIHGYSIPGITGQTVRGYENVQTADGNFLVPFLYPSAKKLIAAAEAARQDGYRLKIYEAYRPNESTRFLYNTTLSILADPYPGAPVPSVPEEEPEPLLPDEEVPEETEPEEPAIPATSTYGWIMTDGRYKVSAFLAASVSNHNRGVALDLTLESLEDGKELEMQSAIHDLSWYAVTSRNNDNAALLEHYMKDAAGLTGLSSEWWHWQDDGIRSELKLSGFLSGGVSCEGWIRDAAGWRYRNADGSIRKGSGTVFVSGTAYEVDADGYVQDQNAA
ncbi:MAG: D-alanyl-D-alanine carboxypeptidase family protein [Oscillospiraceae bacterium]|nr:D-alanyl-D-alanine carboxypeptidase family protein [Oscillospiraceae bacterium]